jgi:gluconolactonase
LSFNKMSLRVSDFVEVASGMEYPEGPVWLADGSVAAVDIGAATLVRFHPCPNRPDGFSPDPPLSLRDAQSGLGSAPNGAAIGPDGYLYICNNGGSNFLPLPLEQNGRQWTLRVLTTESADYRGGYIQRVSLSTGASEIWCGPDSVAGGVCTLRGPDDLVFDESGGIWFTDWGKSQERTRDITGVYYLPAGSRSPVLKLPNRAAPNGIALSPKGDRLYVAETYARWIVYWELDGPGALRPNPRTLDGSYLLTGAIPGQGLLDSMAVDAEGNLYAATMTTEGQDPLASGGITVVSPAGRIIDYIRIDTEIPEPLPSNLCFGGPGLGTAFVTLGGTGRIVSCRMAIPGLPLAFQEELC